MISSEIGKKGEDIATAFLSRKGHKILNRNYRMKFGEIDIVSKKDKILYFIEVKTVAKEKGSKQAGYRVEERVDRFKMEKLSRIVEHYLLHECGDREVDWEFLVVAVTLDVNAKKAFVKVIRETLSE